MAKRYDVPLTMCGELAGRPIEALALMSIGMTRLSMGPPSIGPIKEMVLGLELAADPHVGQRGAERRGRRRRHPRASSPNGLRARAVSV